jgi:hypothetical protein
MMDKKPDLDAIFAEAAAMPVAVPPDLMARILADAAEVQPRPHAIAVQLISKPVGQKPGWLAALAEALGGGRAWAGLSLAGLTGLFLGVVQPAGMPSLTSLLSQTTVATEEMDLLPTPDAIWPETDRTGN